MSICCDYKIQSSYTKPHSPWQKVTISKVNGVLGVNKVPSSYIIRVKPEVPDLSLNPMQVENQ